MDVLSDSHELGETVGCFVDNTFMPLINARAYSPSIFGLCVNLNVYEYSTIEPSGIGVRSRNRCPKTAEDRARSTKFRIWRAAAKEGKHRNEFEIIHVDDAIALYSSRSVVSRKLRG